MYIFGVTGSIRKAGEEAELCWKYCKAFLVKIFKSIQAYSKSHIPSNVKKERSGKRNPFWKTSFFGVLDRKMLVVLHSHQKTLLNEEHSIQPTVLSTWTAPPRWSLARVLNERTDPPTNHPPSLYGK